MLKALADYARLLRAGTALARHDVILPGEYHSRLPFPAKLAGKTLRLFGGGAKGRSGERLATALEKLGPAYIKLGQFLATRPDVFGVETTTDLSRLKDKLPPFSMKAAQKALAEEFGDDEATQLFPELSDPIAAASLAQVHRLQTPDGAKAVKILRPGVEKLIDRELRAMKRAARTVERVNVESRRLKPVAFTETVAASMEKELDLRLEAGGGDVARQFAALSTASEKTAAFGIDPSQVFGFADWVGGRYSVWGPIGLSLMLAIGAQNFEEFLRGGQAMDTHFKEADWRDNLPVMLALVGIWHNQICGCGTRAVLPYDQRLDKLPAYLQQLEMESNGESVTMAGHRRVRYRPRKPGTGADGWTGSR